MIDWERANVLRDEVGPEAFDEVVTLFLDEVEETLAALSTSMSVPELMDALHFLKGSALSVGFKKLAERCRNGEGSEPPTPEYLESLFGIYSESKSEFLTGIAESFGT